MADLMLMLVPVQRVVINIIHILTWGTNTCFLEGQYSLLHSAAKNRLVRWTSFWFDFNHIVRLLAATQLVREFYVAPVYLHSAPSNPRCKPL